MSFIKGVVFFTAKKIREENIIETSDKWQKSEELASLCMSLSETILAICSKNPDKLWHLHDIQQKTKRVIQDDQMQCILNALAQYELLEKVIDKGPYVNTIFYKSKISNPGPGWLRSTFAFVTIGLVAYCFYANYRGIDPLMSLLPTPTKNPIIFSTL